MYYIIPFICGYIGLYTYYVYSSIQFLRILRERHIFYVNTFITLAPAIIYTYSILNTILFEIPLQSFIINNFMIEWSITTPLILLNITDVAKLNITNQLIVTLCAVLMNVCGFVANGVRDIMLMYVFYGCGLVCLFTIFSYVAWIYYQQRWVFIDNPRRSRVITGLLYSLVSTWSFYPVVFMIYKQNAIDFEHVVIWFLCLDFLSKGSFIFTLMRHQELLYIRDSFSNQLKIRPDANYKQTTILPDIPEHFEVTIKTPQTGTPSASST